MRNILIFFPKILMKICPRYWPSFFDYVMDTGTHAQKVWKRDWLEGGGGLGQCEDELEARGWSYPSLVHQSMLTTLKRLEHTNPRNVHSEHVPQFQFQPKESGYTCTKLSSILVILLPSQILEFQFLNQHNKSVNNIIFKNKREFYLRSPPPSTI